jgi:hypothetical protein
MSAADYFRLRLKNAIETGANQEKIYLEFSASFSDATKAEWQARIDSWNKAILDWQTRGHITAALPPTDLSPYSEPIIGMAAPCPMEQPA